MAEWQKPSAQVWSFGLDVQMRECSSVGTDLFFCVVHAVFFCSRHRVCECAFVLWIVRLVARSARRLVTAFCGVCMARALCLAAAE